MSNAIGMADRVAPAVGGDSSHLHAATSSTSGETATYDAAGDMTCRAPSSGTTCAGATPTGAQLAYDAERRLSHWQNAPTNPTSQAWYLYDGSGARVEQYVSGGSGNHTYYLPGGVEEVTPSGSLIKYYSAGGMTIGVNTAHDASGISYLVSDGLGSASFTRTLPDVLRLHAVIVYTGANNRRKRWHRTRIVRASPLAESRWLVQTGVRVGGSSLASRVRETQRIAAKVAVAGCSRYWTGACWRPLRLAS